MRTRPRDACRRCWQRAPAGATLAGDELGRLDRRARRRPGPRARAGALPRRPAASSRPRCCRSRRRSTGGASRSRPRCTASRCGSAATSWSSTTARHRLGQVLELEPAQATGAELDLPGEATAASRCAPASRSATRAARARCSRATARRSTTRRCARRRPRRCAPGRSGAAPRTRLAGDRRARARARRGVRARRRRVRPPHVPVRPVRLGQDVLARRDPRAAAAGDGAADRHPRPELGLRAAGRRPRRAPTPATAERYREAARRSPCTPAATAGEQRLRLRLGELEPAAQAALLRLDPIADREEHAELADAARRGPAAVDRGDARPPPRPGARRLALRARNLGVERFGRVGAASEPGSMLDAVARPGGALRRRRPRVARDARGAGARRPRRCSGALWQHREEREPVLIVIDEAHNVCPARPGGPADRAGHRARRPDRRGGPQVRPLPAGLDPAPAEGARERHLPVRQPRADAAQLGRRRRVRRRPSSRSCRPSLVEQARDVRARRGARRREDLAASGAGALRRARRRGGRLRRPGHLGDGAIERRWPPGPDTARRGAGPRRHRARGRALAAGRVALLPVRARRRRRRRRSARCLRAPAVELGSAHDARGSRRPARSSPRPRSSAPSTDLAGRSRTRSAVAAEHRVVERVAAQVLQSDRPRPGRRRGARPRADRAGGRPRAREPGPRAAGRPGARERLVDELTEQVLRSPELERVVEYIATSPQVLDAVSRQTHTLAEEMVADVRRRAESRRRHRRAHGPRLAAPSAAPADMTGRAGPLRRHRDPRGRARHRRGDRAGHRLRRRRGPGARRLARRRRGARHPRPAPRRRRLGGGGRRLLRALLEHGRADARHAPDGPAGDARAGGELPGVGRSFVRVVGLGLAIIPLFAGFLPVLVDAPPRACRTSWPAPSCCTRRRSCRPWPSGRPRPRCRGSSAGRGLEAGR